MVAMHDADSIPLLIRWYRNIQPACYRQSHRASCIHRQTHLKEHDFQDGLPWGLNLMKQKQSEPPEL